MTYYGTKLAYLEERERFWKHSIAIIDEHHEYAKNIVPNENPISRYRSSCVTDLLRTQMDITLIKCAELEAIFGNDADDEELEL